MKKKMIEIVIFLVFMAASITLTYALIAGNLQISGFPRDVYVNASGNNSFYIIFTKNTSLNPLLPYDYVSTATDSNFGHSPYTNTSFLDNFTSTTINLTNWRNESNGNPGCSSKFQNNNALNVSVISACSGGRANVTSQFNIYLNGSTTNLTNTLTFSYRYKTVGAVNGETAVYWRIKNASLTWYQRTIETSNAGNCNLAGSSATTDGNHTVAVVFRPLANTSTGLIDIFEDGVKLNTLANNLTGNSTKISFDIDIACNNAETAIIVYGINRSVDILPNINMTVIKSSLSPWAEQVNLTPAANYSIGANQTYVIINSNLSDRNLSLVPISLHNSTGGLVCSHPAVSAALSTFSCLFELNHSTFDTNSYGDFGSSALLLVPDNLTGGTIQSYVLDWGKKSNGTETFNVTVASGDSITNMTLYGNYSMLDDFEQNLSSWNRNVVSMTGAGGNACNVGRIVEANVTNGYLNVSVYCTLAGNSQSTNMTANITSFYVNNETDLVIRNLTLNAISGTSNSPGPNASILVGNTTIIGFNCTSAGVTATCTGRPNVFSNNGTYTIRFISSGFINVSNGTFIRNYSITNPANLTFSTITTFEPSGATGTIGAAITAESITYGLPNTPNITIDNTNQVFRFIGQFNETLSNSSSLSGILSAGQHIIRVSSANQARTVGSLFYPSGDLYFWFPPVVSSQSTTSIITANITPTTVFRNIQMNCTWIANSTSANETLKANITWLNGTVGYNVYNFQFTNFTQSVLQTTILNNGSLPSNQSRKGQSWKCNVTVENTITNSQINQLSDAVTISNSVPTVLVDTTPQNYTTLNKHNVTATAVDSDDTTDLLNCTHYHRTAGSNIWSTRLGIFSNVTGICSGEVNTTTSNGSLNYRPNQNIESLLSFYDNSGANVNSSASNNTIPLLAPYIGSNATNPTTVTFGTSFNLSANITGNATITTRFRIVAPSGTAHLDYNTTTLNSSDTYVSQNQPLNESGTWQINITGYNGFGSDISSFNITTAQYAARINNYSLIPPTVTMFNNITGFVNATSDLNLYLITAVNFTLMAPNGSLVINNKNGTRYGTTDARWNSTFFVIRPSGTWMLNATAFTNESNSTISSLNFTVTDNVIAQPASFTATMDPRGKNFTPVFTISHDSTESLAFTFAATMLNDSYFFNQSNISAATFNNGVLLSVLVNITNTNSSLPDAIYDGNLSITRTIDGRVIRVPLRVTVNPPAADIDLLNASTLAKCSGSNCDWIDQTTTVPSSYRWVLNNSGNFSATECIPSVTGSASNISSVFNINDFSLSIGQQRNLTLTFLSKPAGTWIGSVDVMCNATTLGFKDSVSADPTNTPKINFTFPPVAGGGGGGGGGGGAPRVPPPAQNVSNITPLELIIQECGNNICQPELPFSEDAINCPQDCSIKSIKTSQILCRSSQPDCIWAKAWALQVLLGFGLLSVIGLIVYQTQKNLRKRR